MIHRLHMLISSFQNNYAIRLLKRAQALEKRMPVNGRNLELWAQGEKQRMAAVEGDDANHVEKRNQHEGRIEHHA